MNRIWLSIVHLRKINPNSRSKVKYIEGKLESLVILDQNRNYVENKTNQMVLRRRIKNLYGNKFSIEDIYIVDPQKDLGPSLTRY